jgi:hypothetical protein
MAEAGSSPRRAKRRAGVVIDCRSETIMLSSQKQSLTGTPLA